VLENILSFVVSEGEPHGVAEHRSSILHQNASKDTRSYVHDSEECECSWVDFVLGVVGVDSTRTTTAAQQGVVNIAQDLKPLSVGDGGSKCEQTRVDQGEEVAEEVVLGPYREVLIDEFVEVMAVT